jgi:hypothetical protein
VLLARVGGLPADHAIELAAMAKLSELWCMEAGIEEKLPVVVAGGAYAAEDGPEKVVDGIGIDCARGLPS